MRIEIDFSSGNQGSSFKRWALILLPALLVLIVFWFWSNPILETLSPFAVAFVVAYLLNPLVNWMSGESRERLCMNRAVAILLILLVVMGVVGGLIAYIIPGIVRESAQFAERVRTDIGPSLKREIQPKVEAWFAPENLIGNMDFGQWDGEDPSAWQVASIASAVRLDGDGLLLTLPAGASGSLALSQEVSGVIGAETCVLEVSVGSIRPSTAAWICGIEEHSGGESLVKFPLEEEGMTSRNVFVPSGYQSATLGIGANGLNREVPSSIEIHSIRLLKPPPFRILDASFWTDLFEQYRHLLEPATLAKIATYGARGAGAVAEGAGGVWSWLSQKLGGVVSFFGYLTFLLVILFYMLLDFAAFKRGLVSLLPESWQDRFVSVMTEIDRQVGGFIRGQLTVCLCVGGLITIAMLILSVPFAILIGLLGGTFNFIPYLGPALGMVPAVILTLLEFFEPNAESTSVLIKLALVLGSFLVIQAIDGFIISPKVMSSNVDVSPLVVMGALMLGAGIAGVTGMVIAIPIYCVLRVLVGEFRSELIKSTPDEE